MTQIFHIGQPSHGGDRKTFEVVSSTELRGVLDSVASLLAATLYQGNPDRNHKLYNIVSTERYILHMQVLLECWYIWMESSQWENWNHLFSRKVSFLTAPHCQFRGVGQGMINYICLRKKNFNFNNNYIIRNCKYQLLIYRINRISAETMTNGMMIHSGLIVHQYGYRPNNSN